MNRLFTGKFKKIGLYSILLTCLLFIPFYHTKAFAKEEGIASVFSSIHANIEEFNINAHVSQNDRFMQPQEAAKMCTMLAEKLEIQDPMLEDTSAGEDIQVHLKGQNKKGDRVVVMLQSFKNDQTAETHIIVDLQGQTIENEAIEETLQSTEQKIEKSMEPYGKVEWTTCITSSYPGKLKDHEKKEILKTVMRSLEVKEIDKMQENNMMNYIGYSKKMKEWIRFGGKKVNINAAIRYNAYNDKTYLWIATPLITISY
jgi:hypothetical protein